MRVLVTGGRDYADVQQVDKALSAISGIKVLIHGGASGADRLCANWAERRGIHHAEVRALWNQFGPSAGPKRNEAMASLLPDVLIAFPGGRGTAHMRSVAEKLGIRIVEVDDGRS